MEHFVTHCGNILNGGPPPTDCLEYLPRRYFSSWSVFVRRGFFLPASPRCSLHTVHICPALPHNSQIITWLVGYCSCWSEYLPTYLPTQILKAPSLSSHYRFLLLVVPAGKIRYTIINLYTVRPSFYLFRIIAPISIDLNKLLCKQNAVKEGTDKACLFILKN